MAGTRAGADPSDAEVWLRLYGGAVAAKADHREATRLADAGSIEFRRRFPTQAQGDVMKGAVERKNAERLTEIEAGKAKGGEG